MRARTSAGSAGFGTLVVLLLLAAGGYGLYHHFHHDRSVAAYCKVFYGEGQQIRSEYTGINAKTDPLDSLGAIFSAPSQIASFFGQLENVAPMNIEPDVATLQQAFQSEANDLTSDPIAALAQGLINGSATEGASNRVNAWTLKNCGAPPGT